MEKNNENPVQSTQENNEEILKNYTAKIELEKKTRTSKFLKVLSILFIISVIIVIGYIGISNNIRQKEKAKKEREDKMAEVFVPNLIDKTVAEAKQILEKLEVKYEFKTSNPGVDGKNFASTESDAIVKYQQIGGHYVQDNEDGKTLDKRYDTVILTAMTQEMIDYKPDPTAYIAKVEMNKVFTDVNSMNSTTQKVAGCALSYLYNYYPNFRWQDINITQKDDCGRFWVFVHYVKSPSSEYSDGKGIMVWIKDINDDNKMGYYTISGSIAAGSNGWGSPLPDDM